MQASSRRWRLRTPTADASARSRGSVAIRTSSSRWPPPGPSSIPTTPGTTTRGCLRRSPGAARRWSMTRTNAACGSSARRTTPPGARSTCPGRTAAGFAPTSSLATRCPRRAGRSGSRACCSALRASGAMRTGVCTTSRPTTRWRCTLPGSASKQFQEGGRHLVLLAQQPILLLLVSAEPAGDAYH